MPFSVPKWQIYCEQNIFWHEPLLLQEIFWKKLLISFPSTYWPLSLCKISKKFLQQIQSYDDVPFLGPFTQMRIFPENLLISLVSFTHAYLHAKNQNQILIY